MYQSRQLKKQATLEHVKFSLKNFFYTITIQVSSTIIRCIYLNSKAHPKENLKTMK